MKWLLTIIISCLGTLGVFSDKYDEAQAAYRNGDFQVAAQILQPLVAEGRNDAIILMGFTQLQLGNLDESERLFMLLYRSKQGGADVPFGLALLARERKNYALARKYGLEAQKLEPGRTEFQEFLSKLPAIVEKTERAALLRPAKTLVPFTASKGYFRDASGKAVVLRGVNLGVALPGKYPAQFPLEKKTYAEWLTLIGKMNANMVRVYTILPPVFYEALRDYNLAHKQKPLYLISGIWTELPEEEGLDDYRGEFSRIFLEEASRVVDLLHGRIDIQPRPGHASGSYTADVSPWLMGFIIGREWEPYSVIAYNRQTNTPRTYKGKYLEMSNGLPFEAWLAEVMDKITTMQMERYNLQVPIAFTNWPTLDPIAHVAEATIVEERRLQIARGEDVVMPKVGEIHFNEDEVGLDANHIKASKAFPAGTFASYHAYPYYPDFMRNDPELNKASGPHGKSVYAGYLQSLKKHHQQMPVVIAEFGVPSSRGMAHFNPQGLNHGGHGEAEQASIDVRLYDEITASGMAGGIIFAWLDEWFKRNWLYYQLDRPVDRRAYWHSLMDAEQNYGILAAVPANQPRLQENRARWASQPVLTQQDNIAVKTIADPEYLHLLIETPLGPEDKLELMLDTHPGGGAPLDWTGINHPDFKLTLRAKGGKLEGVKGYQTYIPFGTGDLEHIDYFPKAFPGNVDAWLPLRTEPNRRRIGRDGVVYPRATDEPGLLKPGLDPADSRDATKDYVWTNTGLQIRIPWTMILVTDPSSRSVYDGQEKDLSRTVNDMGINVRVIAGSSERSVGSRFGWPTWGDDPAFELRLKPLYGAFQQRWSKALSLPSDLATQGR